MRDIFENVNILSVLKENYIKKYNKLEHYPINLSIKAISNRFSNKQLQTTTIKIKKNP